MKKELEVAELSDYSPNTIVINKELREDQFEVMDEVAKEFTTVEGMFSAS